MTFAALRNEYDRQIIGEQIYSLVRELCGLIAHRYPAAVYNDRLQWSDESYDDLCLDVANDLLLERGQIHYIFGLADSVEAVRRLLTFQIKRKLAERRAIGPVDRLLRRVRELACTGAVEFIGGGYRSSGSACDRLTLGRAEIQACVRVASEVPRLFSRLDSGRESMIYTADRLRQVIQLVLGVVTFISERDLREVFEHLLTPWIPTLLVPVEEDHASASSEGDRMIAESHMHAAIQTLAKGLSHPELRVLVMKSQGVADSVVAQQIGKSRPTTANLKSHVLSRVAAILEDVDQELHPSAMQLLLDEAACLIEETP
jgi:DNA-binding CsgD family transcriptional regulator